jgi:hypothetical protein
VIDPQTRTADCIAIEIDPIPLAILLYGHVVRQHLAAAGAAPDEIGGAQVAQRRGGRRHAGRNRLEVLDQDLVGMTRSIDAAEAD